MKKLFVIFGFVALLWSCSNNNPANNNVNTEIEEAIRLGTVSIFPNPTTENVTVTFELEKSCNLKIVLCDLLGYEVINIYDGFIIERFFSKTINIKHLPKGVYSVKILVDGDTVFEKFIVLT